MQAASTSTNQANASNNDPGKKAKKSMTKETSSYLLFVIVVLISLANCEPNNILAHFWVVVMAIVCPLIDMFIPGIFYFRVMKD